jgi:acetylornithine deacetylase/succinyl-diaminopimelate desuccinylase-like protein
MGRSMLHLRRLAAILASAIIATIPAFPADDSTAELLSQLIRVDTSNPPGQEGKTAELLASKFRALGIDITIVPTPEPGKSHFFARLKGDGTKKPVLLAAHADVVGVERDKWTLDPFAGVIKDGYVYGRGAIDFKGGIAVFAQAVMMLARKHVPLHRDVIFLSEVDEENGRYNTTWLAESHWDLMDCEFALNEGGWVMKDAANKVRYVSVSTADKLSVSMTLTAKGTSTHSSMPRPDNAIFTLAKAMAKVAEYDTPPRLNPSTREFFLTLAKTSKPPMSTYFNNLVNSQDRKLVHQADVVISQDPLLHAIMRNTIAPVFLNAGFRGNVIPGSAQATLNFRVIPGTDPRELVSEIQAVVHDPRIEVALLPGTSAARPAASSSSSSTDTDLYRALSRAAQNVWAAPVTSYLFQAGTDAGAWRNRGVPVYGIYPYPISAEDLTRMHGNDERVPVASLEQGTQVIYNTLLEVAAK